MLTQEMIQSLVRQVDESTPHKMLFNPEDQINEVVWESDLDGVHYYLIRCRPPEKNTIHLTPREQEIVKLVAQGLPNKCIAKQLGISQWTVAAHLRRIFQKMGVSSRVAIVARLLEENLLPN